MIADYLRLSSSNVKKRKLRVFLTLLGIMIAIATIFMLISLSIGLQEAVQEQFRLLGADKFFIQPKGQLGGPGTGGAIELTDNDFDVIKKISGVKEATYYTAASAKIEYKDKVRYFAAVGLDLNTADLFTESSSYKALEGRFIKKGDIDGVMLGYQYAHNNLFEKPIKAGDKILINGKEFNVKTILSSTGDPQNDQLVYMSIKDLRALFNIPTRIDFFIVQIESGEDIKVVAAATERKLMKSRGLDEKTIDFTVITPEELLKSFEMVLNIITGFLLGVAAISLLVGGIGIANTMFTSVLERTKEIGIMKSIGAKNSDILIIFLMGSALLGLAGGLLGIGLGYTVSKTIEYIGVNQLNTNLLKAATPLYLVIGCIAFAVLSGSISGTIPAYRASKIKPVDALRYE